MIEKRPVTKLQDPTPPAGDGTKKLNLNRQRTDVDRALSAGFSEDEVRFMLDLPEPDLPEEGEAR
ncbi:hypothetical protein VQ042_07815 [Aurantimonas sp. A2-1-M11]|uniref:hypothetical protein n=1 Tax=Aurantimonas sp. A2-1-M11 TaxID=3113712 RepID=UPI002F93339F